MYTTIQFSAIVIGCHSRNSLIPLSHYMQYVPQLQVILGGRTTSQVTPFCLELFTLQAVKFAIIRISQNGPVLQLPFEICMQPCVTVTKCPLCISTRLMSPHYTERQPNHSLMYIVAYFFGYHSHEFICTCVKTSVHAHGPEI